MQKTVWFSHGCLAIALLLTTGCDDNTPATTAQHQPPTQLPIGLRALSQHRSAQQTQQQQHNTPSHSLVEVEFDCTQLKHHSPLCNGMCRPDTNAETCEPATVSSTCNGKSPDACIQVPNNRCIVDYRGTNANGNPYTAQCIDNQMQSCQLDANFDLANFCQTRNTADPLNNHAVCTHVADTQTCTSPSIDQLCKVTAARKGAGGGNHCGDVVLGLGNTYTKMCQDNVAVADGFGANKCIERNANLCSLVWNHLPAARKTQANCENIAILPNGTTVDPIEGAPRATAALAGHTRHAAGIKPCRYSGKPAHYKPNLQEFRNMCAAIDDPQQCGTGNTKQICQWVANTL